MILAVEVIINAKSIEHFCELGSGKESQVRNLVCRMGILTICLERKRLKASS